MINTNTIYRVKKTFWTNPELYPCIMTTDKIKGDTIRVYIVSPNGEKHPGFRDFPMAIHVSNIEV